ncbi:hypothetical protein CJP46_07725 [Paenibacillus sp. XY044]|nr:hypothetical protein CJP46_07725 [Paenibacillus sp. XY044]
MSVTRMRGPSPYPEQSSQKTVPSAEKLRDVRTAEPIYRFVKDDYLFVLYGNVSDQVITGTVLQLVSQA